MANCSKCNDTGSLSRDVYDGTLDCTHCEAATERMALLDWFHQNFAYVTQAEVWRIYQHGKAAVTQPEAKAAPVVAALSDLKIAYTMSQSGKADKHAVWLEDVRALLATAGNSQGHAMRPAPFMFAIMGPDGKAYFDEHCVDPTPDALYCGVNALNDSPDAGYSVVPLYTAQPAAQPEQQPVAQNAPDAPAGTHQWWTHTIVTHRDVLATPEQMQKHLDIAEQQAALELRDYGGPGWWRMKADKIKEGIDTYPERLAALAAPVPAAAPEPSNHEPMPEPISLIARPLLYAESVNGVQVGRDDLWIVTTHLVNRAAASELAAPEPPQGWKLVPMEPTSEMLKAGINAYRGFMLDAYRSMLAAAPVGGA